MSHRCSWREERKALDQKKRQHVSEGPTKCLVLDSFAETGGVPVACVADVHMPHGSCEQPPPLTSLLGTKEGTLRAFHFWTGEPMATASQRVRAPVTALLVLPEHALVWCGDERGYVTAFRFCLERGLQGGDLCTPLNDPSEAGHQTAVTCFAAGGNDFVYSGSVDGSLARWLMHEPFEFAGRIGCHKGELACIACVRGEYLVSVGPDSAELHVWPIGEKQAACESFTLRGHSGSVFCCIHIDSSLSGAGLLWSGGDDRFIRLWELSDPVHLSSHIVSPKPGRTGAMDGLSSRMEGIEDGENDDETDGGDESMQDNSFRMLAGHRGPIVSLRAFNGLVFSCDASGALLSWNADRYRLLHAFLVPLEARPRQLAPDDATSVAVTAGSGDSSAVVEIVRGARCLGFMEGFLWVIDTCSGPRSVYMPGHPRLRKLLCDSTADILTPPSAKRSGETAFMNGVGAYMCAAVNLLLHYVELHSAVFSNSILAVTRWKTCDAGVVDLPRSTSPLVCPRGTGDEKECVNGLQPLLDRCATIDDFQAACIELEQERALLASKRREEEERWCRERQRLAEEALRLDGRAQALDRLQASLLEARLQQERNGVEREELLQALTKRDKEREHQLVRFSAELSFLRIKYGDWSCVIEESK